MSASRIIVCGTIVASTSLPSAVVIVTRPFFGIEFLDPAALRSLLSKKHSGNSNNPNTIAKVVRRISLSTEKLERATRVNHAINGLQCRGNRRNKLVRGSHATHDISLNLANDDRLGRLAISLSAGPAQANAQATATKRPNILFAIADDWGYGHASAYGCQWTKTPAFDRVAREGLLFTQAYTPNAKCAPSRACLLTGRNSWQLEAACNHICFFPTKVQDLGRSARRARLFRRQNDQGLGAGRRQRRSGQAAADGRPAFDAQKAPAARQRHLATATTPATLPIF